MDIDSLLIVAASVTIHPNDKKELESALQELQKLPIDIRSPDTILADTGYYSAANIQMPWSQDLPPDCPKEGETSFLTL